ncbi:MULTISPECIES: diguanylate cyclase domain-containing protein [Methylobacterium]|uniref:diguanylate cyclase domain-containing protein n=1 Tax=Methylobacterium TaxID=407 RepID=UPI0028AD7F5E|nr:diguanylate cyclase [Methylobacterium sp. DB0501]
MDVVLLVGRDERQPPPIVSGAHVSLDLVDLCRSVSGPGLRAVADLRAVARWRAHPAVAGAPGCRFVATHALGPGSGLLALVDRQPRRLTAAQRRRLADFAAAAECLVQVAGANASLGKALAHSRKIFDRASAAARIGVWECDLPAETLTWTDQVYAMFDLPPDTPLDRGRIVACYAPDSLEALVAARSRAIAERGGFTLDAEIVTVAGRRRWIRITAQVECEGTVPVRIFGMKQDITEEKLLADRTRYLAEFDTMTGLANRATFEAQLAALDQAPPGRRPYGALLLVDLDGFKPVNDTLGHAAGDACLVEVASRLRQSCRDGDLVARIGGDEFAILLAATAPGVAEDVASRLVAALNRPMTWAGRVFGIGASIGIVRIDGRPSADLFMAADAMLYAAKADGRGRFRVAAGAAPGGPRPATAA